MWRGHWTSRVRTFSRMVVDDTLKRNVDFQGKAGCGPGSSAPLRATAANGGALWPVLTITPMCRKMFTAATSAAAAGWNMTPAPVAGERVEQDVDRPGRT